MIGRLALLGATGDLAGRYLLPALARLAELGRLPDRFELVGVDLADWDSASFRRYADERLDEFADASDSAREALLGSATYRRADVTDPQQLGQALAPVDVPLIAYLALPPSVTAAAITSLAQAGLADGSRLVVEKPFGENLSSARALNRLIRQAFPETAVFRMDHFLGERAFQSILALRFGNRLFEPLWNRQHIERVDIVWDETLALEGRAGYYDRAGALRDMVQSHLLQVLSLVALEPPSSLHERELRQRKHEVLQAVRRLSPREVAALTLRARYTAGAVGGAAVPAYVEEPGVDPDRGTETFAQVSLFIDNERWSDVPFVLRTGKALRQDRLEVAIRFRDASPQLYDTLDRRSPNVLRLGLQPDRLSLNVSISGAQRRAALDDLELGALFSTPALPAYARLLEDVLEGDLAHAVRYDAAEECWEIVQPILDAWAQGQPPLLEYAAGSDGPERTS